MILGSQAKLENDNKSINVKRGLKTKCEMGLWPSVAPTGYLNSKNVEQKGQVFVDPVRGPVIKEMFTRVAYQAQSGRTIFKWLDLDKSGVKKKLEIEIERHKRFYSGVMGKTEQEYNAKDADIRNYAKYLLTEGSIFEKRDLLTCLKSKIMLKDKKVIL
jgi:hypothetical protein